MAAVQPNDAPAITRPQLCYRDFIAQISLREPTDLCSPAEAYMAYCYVCQTGVLR